MTELRADPLEVHERGIAPSCAPADQPETGCLPLTRKRGEALERAIYAACLHELARVGLTAMTIEGVANVARTGKASIYRRWPSKEELVVDTLQHTMPSYADPPDTGSTRDDLVDVFTRVAHTISSPAGCAISMVMAEVEKDRELIMSIKHRVLEPRKRMVMDLLRRGVERGEVRPDAVTLTTAEIVPSMLVMKFLTDGPPIPDGMVEQIVDEVLMPVVRP